MKPQDKKSILLWQLSQEREPISLPDLLLKLPESFAERSVRRWLQALIKEGLAEKWGSRRSTRYLAKKSSDKSPPHLNRCFGSESTRVIAQVREPLYNRRPATYRAGWLDAYEPNHTFYFSEPLRDQLSQAGYRSTNNDPAGTYAHKIFNRLLIDLSYNSSRLEGNTYSVLDTERLVLQGIGADGKLDEEKVMIINHKEAIRYLVDHAPHLRVNIETICTVHYLLSDGLVEPKYSGKLRDHGVRIGGSTYIPLANKERLQIYLNEILEKSDLIEDSFEQSLFLLIQISYIQAFADVNKRTARLSANIPLITRNFVPLSFNDVERGDYASAMLAIYELQDVRPLVDLYVYSYLRTCITYDLTVQSLGFDRVRVSYRLQRRAVIRRIIEEGMGGEAIRNCIQKEAIESVAEVDRSDFIADVLEDLEQIDQSRIQGLGVTSEQLSKWLASNPFKI